MRFPLNTVKICSQLHAGTKLHQRTRKAIAKRQPALMAAIRKYNGYCAKLADLYNSTWLIPLPTPLPTKLNELRSHDSLMEDVWIAPSIGQIPCWMKDPAVREGIRAMLKRDRCLEEQRRLGIEADNLCRWYGYELAAVELALRMPESQYIPILDFTADDSSDESYFLPLRYRREQLLTLPLRWSNSLVSKARFDSHTQEADVLALKITRRPRAISPHPVAPTVIEDTSGEESWQTDLEPDITIVDSVDLIALDYFVEETSVLDADENTYVVQLYTSSSIICEWAIIYVSLSDSLSSNSPFVYSTHTISEKVSIIQFRDCPSSCP